MASVPPSIKEKNGKVGGGNPNPFTENKRKHVPARLKGVKKYSCPPRRRRKAREANSAAENAPLVYRGHLCPTQGEGWVGAGLGFPLPEPRANRPQWWSPLPHSASGASVHEAAFEPGKTAAAAPHHAKE